MVDFPSDLMELLDSERLARIATIDQKARPHGVTIWFAFAEGQLYFATNHGTKKLRNLENNPEIAVIVDDGKWDRPRSYTILGTTKIYAPSDPEFDPAFEHICAKYPRERQYKSDKSRIVHIIPRHVAYRKKSSH